MSKLFDYLYNELGVTALGSQLADIEHIVLGDEEYINRQNEAMALSPAPAKTAEDKFIEKHLINVMDLTAEAMIVTRLESMYGGLEMASVSYFIETGKVTGSLYLQVKKMMIDFAERWHSTAALQSQPCQTGYSREDMVNALIEFIAYRSKVGTTDIANDAKQFESRFYLQEKSLTNKPTTDDTKNKKAN